MVFQLRPEDGRAYNYPNAQDPNFLGYDRKQDRWKVDASGIHLYASGISVDLDHNNDSVAIWSASGTRTIPTYIDGGFVDTSTDESTDSIRIYSASGTTDVPVYITSPVEVEVTVGDEIKILSSSGTPQIPVYAEDPVPVEEQNVDSDGYINDSAHHYAWNDTSGAWQKVRIDPSTGAMLIKDIAGSAISHAALANLNWAGAGHTIDSNIVPIASGSIDLGTVVLAFDEAYIDKVYLESNPTTPLQAATKQYVDLQLETKDTFIELTDTPVSYVGEGGNFLRVNATPDAVEFITLTADLIGAGSLDIGANAFTVNSIEIVGNDGEVNAAAIEDKFLRNDGADSTTGRLTAVGFTSSDNILPNASGTIDIGSVSYAFDEAYIDKIYLEADPTTPLMAATKQYVDDSVIREDLWNRTGTLITTAIANNDLQIDGDMYLSASGIFQNITTDSITASGDITAVGDATFADAVLSDSNLGTPTYNSICDYLSTATSIGRTSGGTVSNGTNAGTVQCTSGTGYIKTTASDVGALKSIDFPATDNVALTSGLNFLVVRYASPTPLVVVETLFTNIDFQTEFVIGYIFYDSTTGKRDILQAGNYLPNSQVHNCVRLFYRGAEHMNGAMISEVATRKVAATAGLFYFGYCEILTGIISGDDNFEHYYYRDSPSGWKEVAATNQIDNTYWDDGTGVLNDLTANRYGIHWIYMCFEGDLSVVFGRGDYTLSQAEAASVPSDIPDYLAYFGILAGKIIIKKGDATFTSIESAYANLFTFTQVSDHGDLAGLNDDDHIQYFLADGTRDISGNLIPDASGTRDIGTVTDAFDDAYIDKVYLEADPTEPLQAATKRYVDSQVAGKDTFLELTDTPAAYTDMAASGVRVNATPDGLEFYDPSFSNLSDVGSLTIAKLDGSLKAQANFTVDGGGSAVASGALKSWVRMPFAATITGWEATCNPSGTFTMDVNKTDYSGFPGSFISIAGTEKPAVNVDYKAQDLSLGTWTTNVDSGDYISIDVDVTDTVEKIYLSVMMDIEGA